MLKDTSCTDGVTSPYIVVRSILYLKWLPDDHWIGLSGHKVKPKLCIAAGISGQIQHIAGMRDSGIIVAVNKDPEALIFKSADYGIVGDLYEVLPKITNAIKEKMG